MNNIKLALEKLIEHEFPKIKNLNIIDNKDLGLSISFNEGEYTEQEVSEFIEKVRSEIIKPELFHEVIKHPFGYSLK